LEWLQSQHVPESRRDAARRTCAGEEAAHG
jgi:hypothetical protein